MVGQGIFNKKYGSICLLCLGQNSRDMTQNCSKVRHAYFSVDGKDAYFFGRTYVVSCAEKEPSEEELSFSLKEMYLEYKTYHNIPSDRPMFAVEVSELKKDGWSWSSHPVKVNKTTFGHYFHVVDFFLEGPTH